MPTPAMTQSCEWPYLPLDAEVHVRLEERGEALGEGQGLEGVAHGEGRRPVHQHQVRDGLQALGPRGALQDSSTHGRDNK